MQTMLHYRLPSALYIYNLCATNNYHVYDLRYADYAAIHPTNIQLTYIIRHRKTQKDTERHRKTQKDTESQRKTQKDTERQSCV